MDAGGANWTKQFQIQSEVDLDFVIGQRRGHPVGMQSKSPAEFKRRVLAAKLSYELQLNSIDYTLKRYVKPDVYETDETSLGETISHYLRGASTTLLEELKKLHTRGELPFGVLGAELTLFRLPHALDTARMLSNRGLLLEVLPLLRMCLEMVAWAHTRRRGSFVSRSVNWRRSSSLRQTISECCRSSALTRAASFTLRWRNKTDQPA